MKSLNLYEHKQDWQDVNELPLIVSMWDEHNEYSLHHRNTNLVMHKIWSSTCQLEYWLQIAIDTIKLIKQSFLHWDPSDFLFFACRISIVSHSVLQQSLASFSLYVRHKSGHKGQTQAKSFPFVMLWRH